MKRKMYFFQHFHHSYGTRLASAGFLSVFSNFSLHRGLSLFVVVSHPILTFRIGPAGYVLFIYLMGLF